MSGYGEAALEAVKLITLKKIEDPGEAWELAVKKQYIKESTQNKSCPKDAFLGLCEEGLIKGIPAGSYTSSIENKKYAINAVKILQKNPELSDEPIRLWYKSIDDKTISENNQMDVVISLWKNNLIQK